MSGPLQARLAALQVEYSAGQKMLAESEARRTALIGTLLRIEGAIQVLKEFVDCGAENGAHTEGPIVVGDAR